MNRAITQCQITIKHTITFFTLMMLFTVSVNAAQIPDPALSQKKAIDQMHNKLHNDQASAKEKETQVLKELNEITINENIKLEDINAKIDELMAAKTEIMRLRYAHLVEMRKILSDDQKIDYDKALLQRSTVK